MTRPVAGGLAAGGAALIAVWLAVPLPATRVEVSGNERLSRAEIVRLANVRVPARLTWRAARRIGRTLGARPEFESVRVMRGLTGRLHLGVRERTPVAWIVGAGCHVSADGRLLPHLTRREADRVALESLTPVAGRVPAAIIADALALARVLDPDGGAPAGTLRRRADGWEWVAGRRLVRFTAPVRPGEAERLRKFRAAFPAAWDAAGRVDVRFAGRVVVAAR